MKPKGEITYIPDTTIKEIKIAVHIISAIAIIVCARYIRLGIKYEALNQEKQALEGLAKMQSSMIADLEVNCRDLYIEIENLKFGGNE